MFPLLWWVIWVIVAVFPTTGHWIKNVWRYLVLGGMGLLFGFFALATLTIDTYMILWLVFFKLFIAASEFLLAYLQGYRIHFEERKKLSIFGNGASRKRIHKWLLVFTVIAIIVFSALTLWQTQAMAPVNNASAFNQLITFEPAGTPLFQHEVPNSMVRLTTDVLAESIASRSAAHFGSVQVGSAHLTIYKGRLVWVVTMIPLNLWGDNSIKGFVIVDANNPELDTEIVDQSFSVGEALMYVPPSFLGGIQGNAYWRISTAYAYGRATLTSDDNGQWKYVLTSNTVEQWSFVSLPKGVYVYNQHGQVENFYGMNQIPDWVTQRYDEGWIESMITKWGGHRRGSGFDIFAGGFGWIPASPDRVEISDTTRWIIDPDTNKITALVAVDFVGQAQTMAGIFKLNDNGIYYYDMKGLDVKSGLQAQNVIESKFSKPTTGSYTAQMPLLYPINGKNAWFVPIYWETAQGESTSAQATIRLAGLGIVDAENLDHLAIVMTSETTNQLTTTYEGADLVKEAKSRFEGNQPSAEKTVNGTLESKFSYVQNGNTIYVLTINGIDYAVNTQNLDFKDVSKIENLHIDDQVTIIADASNEFIRFPS